MMPGKPDVKARALDRQRRRIARLAAQRHVQIQTSALTSSLEARIAEALLRANRSTFRIDHDSKGRFIVRN